MYTLLPFVLLLILCLTAFLVYRRCLHSKLSLANIITLDLQDPESCIEILSSRPNSTSSDTCEGVFLMVYLPPPYEETLTKITRAASLTSGKDNESMKMEDLEAILCPEIKSNGYYVWLAESNTLYFRDWANTFSSVWDGLIRLSVMQQETNKVDDNGEL